MTEYVLRNTLFDQTYHTHSGIAVVGCGGTGSFAAEGLCRLLLTYPQTQHSYLLLIDGDRVEERNLVRQNFYPEELGKLKSQAMAERLSRKYRVPVAYRTTPLLSPTWEELAGCGLVIGCVDNAAARSAIAKVVTVRQWWLDSGNGNEFGQVVVGNSSLDHLGMGGAFESENHICRGLPIPTLVHPELLVPEPRRPSCAEAVAAGAQGPTINQFMALLLVEMVRRLIEGRLTWWQVFIDLKAGNLHTVSPTPESISKLTGIRLKTLVRRR